MKKCSKCQRQLPFDAFHIDKGHADGRASCCKQCRGEWVAARRADVARYNAEYYARNRERRIVEIHEYQQRHPEVKVKYRHSYRARKYQAGGSHTAADLVAIFEAQHGQCFYCDRQHLAACDGHFDHIIPLSRGGSDGVENIVFACRPCNWSKHDRLPHEWRSC